MASVIPNKFKVSLAKEEIHWVNDTFRASMVSSSYTPNQDTDQYWSDVSANEVGSAETITNTAVTQDDTNDRAIWDCDDIQFTGFTGTFRYMVVYQWTGSASTSRLVRIIDLEGADVTLVNGTYDITIPAGGILSLQ